MSDTTKARIGYGVIIISLLIWVAIKHEQVERYRYAEGYLRGSIQALQARQLGLD